MKPLKYLAVFAFAVGFPAVLLAQAVPQSLAQTQPPAPLPTPDSLAGGMGAAWNSTAAQVQGLLSGYQRLYVENAALKAHDEALDAYLKACGDKPGCTVPVPGAATDNMKDSTTRQPK